MIRDLLAVDWDATPIGGYTTGKPWLQHVDPAILNVADQRDDPDSLLALYRDLLAWRRQVRERGDDDTP